MAGVHSKAWRLMDHAMLNVQEFFQHQVDECLELAKGAVHREDAEFWEESARRWAELAKHKVKRNAALFPIDQPSTYRKTGRFTWGRPQKTSRERH